MSLPNQAKPRREGCYYREVTLGKDNNWQVGAWTYTANPEKLDLGDEVYALPPQMQAEDLPISL